ncbi:hypothetical protein LPB136_04755 [Tenacibaculum todarodis]|uniref:VWFA domain-containing protein n=2 Tax=Tenacibaculum todarodis TaxID=1850252 RepID=A0A1L3JHU4_9FLAO|nr:hypothetical protein LPB136_04755 [Tenacibaculum todarodis]
MFFAYTLTSFSQNLTINKDIVANGQNCNQFDVTLTVTGNPAVQPQEVVLLIDNSGSMADEITINGQTKTLLEVAQDAAKDFVENIFTNQNDPTQENKVAIVSYNSFASTEINLTGGASKQSILDQIDDITTGGSTNFEDALIKAKEILSPPAPQATFNCRTSRSIILFTDGVARWHNGLGTNVTGDGQCSDTTLDTACQTRAFTAADDIETITVNGETYDQNIFTVGFTGTLSNDQENVSRHTLDRIQNAGAYYTDDAADLSNIYNQILGQLIAAATPLPGESLVNDVISSEFQIVPNSLSSSKGTFTSTAQEIDWFIDRVANESVILNYSIVSTVEACGISDPGTSTINYINSDCSIENRVFINPEVCVPCPEATASISRDECNTSINYSGVIDQSGCTAAANDYSWVFYLNNVEVGTSNQLSGTFDYTGINDFTGTFKAELTYEGTFDNGCILPAIVDEGFLNLPSPIEISETITPVTCNGESNGAINISVSEGYGSYQFEWSNGETTQNISGLSAGDYSVTVTDAQGCMFATEDFTVVEPVALTATAVENSPVVCKGESNGSATVTVSGGNGSYTYSWDNSASTSATATDLSAGLHTITIKDSKDCETTTTVTISEPALALIATAVENSPVVCKGESNGSATVTVSGGNGSYTYSWDNSASTSATATDLSAGLHTITIKDSKDCETTTTVTISEPALALTATAVENSPVVCKGESNGSATVTVSGGNGSYTYSWDNSASTSATATDLSAGLHTITIKDSKDCETTTTVTISEPVLALTATAVENSPVVCKGESNGSATVTASGGNGSYTYSWDNSASTSATATDLSAGLHTITIKDSKDCETTATVTITEPALALIVTAVENSPVVCKGESNGSATVTVSGGNGSYTYSWDNSASTSATATDLSAGLHTITIKDSKDCETTTTVTISEPALALTATAVENSPVVCKGESNGSATVTASGGNGSYTYSWDNSASTSATATDLSAGLHTITIKDSKDCETTATVTITEPALALIATAVENSPVVCKGESNGSATVTVSGGNGSYTYSWDNSASTSATATDLSAGLHTITIKDSKDCETTTTVTITEPALVEVIATATDETGVDFNDGTLTASPSGGSGTFTYVWDLVELESDGSSQGGIYNTETVSNVPPGSYLVTITDSFGCTATDTAVINPYNCNTAVVIDSVIPTPVGCKGESTGSAVASVTALNPPLIYAWTNSSNSSVGTNSATLSGVPTGVYTVKVTDSKGCFSEATVTITEPSEVLVANASVVSHQLTLNGTEGSVTATPTGGTTDYTYSWVNSSNTSVGTTQTVSGLLPGDYTVTVTDENDCTAMDTVTINAINCTISLEATFTEIFCNGESSTATATVSNGTAPFTYTWKDASGTTLQTTTASNNTTDQLTGLLAGVYTVSIIDSQACPTNKTITITEPNLLSLGAAINPVSCKNGNDGSIELTVTGGTLDYTYSWTGPNGFTSSNKNLISLEDGTYNVVVTDSKGCTANLSREITEPDAIVEVSISTNMANVVCFGDTTGQLTASTTGGTVGSSSDYTYSWTGPNGFTATTAVISNLGAGNYIVIAKDLNGCEATESYEILGVTAALSASISSQEDISCAGTGSVTILAEGGKAPYSYLITGNQTAQNTGVFNNLEAGTYTVTITDDYGCEQTQEVTILENCTLAVNDFNFVYENQSVSGNVLTNDEDFEGDTQTVTSTTVTTAQGVTVNINAITGEYTYTAPANYVGEDSFTYTIVDDGNPLATDTATVYIEVLPEGSNNNLPPIANPDTNITKENTQVTGTVLNNDFDVDGNNITVTSNTNPSNGTVSINPNGTYTYNPTNGFIGEDTFSYTICDDGTPSLCDETTVTITVISDEIENVTIANDDAYITVPDRTITGNVLNNDFDPEGNTQTVNINPVSGPTNGTVQLMANGEFSYTPTSPTFTGTDAFVYEICDNGTPQDCDQATVYIAVSSVSDLSLTKTSELTTDADASTTFTPFDTVTFVIKLNNDGPSDANGVEVEDHLPDGYEFVSANADVGSFDNNTGLWNVGTITNQQTATLNIIATIKASGEYENITQVTKSNNFDPDSTPNNDDGDQSEDDEANNTPGGGIDDASDISLDKTSAITVDADNSTTPSPGDTVEFTISVNNNGPNDAPGVVVTDQIPTGYTLTNNTASQGSYDSNTGIWTIGTIANQATVTLTITATINATGEYTNLAEVTASDNFDPDSTPNNGVDTDNDGNVENDPDDEDDGDGELPGDDGVQPTSDISLDKTSAITVDADNSTTPSPGDTVEFTISVNNNGPNDAPGVVVTDQIPTGYTLTSNTASQGSYDTNTGVWTIGTIANQATVTLVITATINATGEYTNLAEVTASDNFDPDSTPNNGVDTDNDGNVENDPDDEDDGDGELPGDDGVQPTSDISLDKTSAITVDADNSTTPSPGDTVEFTISVNNNGPNEAPGVVVTDQIPTGYTLTDNTASQGSYDTNTGVWTIGTIANQATVTLTITATINATGEYTNLAEVTASDNFDPDSTPNNGVDTDNDGNVENDPDDEDDGDGELPGDDGVQPTSDISLDKTSAITVDADNSTTPSPGDTVEFTISVNNNGPNEAPGVVVTDQIPTGYTLTDNTASQGSYDTNTGVWTIGTIANQATVTLTITATINATGEYTNLAEVTASDNFDPDSTPNNGVDTDNDGNVENDPDDEDDGDGELPGDDGVQPTSDISLDKTSAITNDADASTTPSPGDTVEFTISVNNNGPNEAPGVVVTDELPDGYTMTGNTPSQGSYDSNTGIWTIGTIANQATVTLTITATINATGEYTNLAEVTASDNFDPDSTPNNGVDTDNDGNVENDPDDEDDGDGELPGDDGVQPTSDISLDKTSAITVDADNSTTPSPGDTVEFTISVNNNGPNEAPGVVVTDQIPTGYTLTDNTPSQGSYDTNTGVWTIGTIANQATVTLVITATINATGEYTNLAEVTASDNFDPDSTPNNGVDTDNDGNVENDPDDEDDGDGEEPGDDGVQPTSDISLDKTSAITVDADNSTTPSPGDTVEFTISVNNNGPNEAPGVVVTDQIPTGYTLTNNTASQGSYDTNTGVWTIGTIANQATVTLTITATINATGEYTNLAEVTASDNFDPDSTPNNGVDTDNDGNVEDDADDEDDGDGEIPGDDGVQPTSDISLDKTSAITFDADNSTTPSPGDTVEFTISVNNNGPNEAPGVVVTDQIPTGYTLTNNTASQGSYDSNTGIWTIGTIANQATVTLTITATINATGEYTNLAEVTASDNFDPDSTPNNGVDTDNDGNVENDPDDEDDGDGELPGDDGVQPTSDISLDKTSAITNDADASTTPSPGDTVEFTISVNNNGPNEAPGVVVTDQIPTGYTLTNNTASQGSYDSNTGVWTIGTIANQATVTLTITATINATGEYTNLAEVTASDNFDPDSTPNNGVDTDNDGNVENDPDDEDDGDGELPGDDGVQPTSDISLDKTSAITNDADASTTPSPGDTVEFTISVNNNGPNEAPGVVVTDQIPTGYTLTNNTASQGSYDSNTGVWTIGTIANQATVTLTITATINATGEYTNLAEVTASDNFDPDSTPNNGVDTDNDGNVEDDADDEDDGDGELPGDDGVQPTSDISLDKTSAITVDADNSGTPSPGDTVEFTISVNNNGPNEAPGVVVTDQIPTGYTLTNNTASQGSYDSNTGVWTIGTIANQATVTLTITATINATGEYTNLAEVTASDNFDPDSTPNNGVDTDNDGNVENDPDDEDDGDGELPGDDGVQPTSDISLDKTSAITVDADNSTTPSPGDTVEFTISVNNNGPNEAPGVVVTDELPDGYTMTGNTPSQGSYDTNTGVWTIGTIANQATVTLTITATINATGEYTNLAEVTASDNFDPDSTPNNGVDTDNDGNVENDPDDEDDGDGELPGDDGVQPTSDISLDKTSAITVDADNSTTPSPGDTVEFTISVNNNGPNEAPGVVVTDQIPTGYTLTNNTASQGSYDTNTGIWTIGTIANQATVTLVITATINATGEYTNLAEVTASDNFDPDSTPNNGVDTDNDGNVENDPDDEDDGDGELPGDDGVQPTSDISLDKTSAITNDADASTTPSPGDTVEFTISVNNNGPNEAPGVVVTDELPDGYTMTGNTPSQGSYDTNTGVWTIGTIANQATVTLTITATINATGEYTNLAEVTASDNFDPDSTPNNGVDTDNDGNVENDPDDEDDGDGEIPGDDGVQPTSDISLDKTSAITVDADNSTTPSPGDTVEFTISVNNNGPNEAPGVVVTDQIPTGYTLTNNTASQGSYDTNTGVWTIGSIANQATVTLVIEATINATGEYTNLAEVTASDNFDPDSTPNNGVDTDNDGNVENDPDDEDDGDGEIPGDDGVQPTSDISLDKTSAITVDADNSTTPSPGDTVEFTISVNNNGPNEAPGVVVTDELPDGYTMTGNTPSQGSYDTNTGVWTIGTIANQATVTLTITATINATGEYTNLAEVTASDNFDPDSTPNNGVDTDNDGNVEDDADDEDDGDGELPGDDGVQPTSDISLDKTSAITVDADNSTTPSPGDTVEFTISVNNNGPNEAPGVVVTDQIPTGYTLTNNTASQGSYDTNTGIWTIGTIANQATVTLVITATINATGEYTNLAEVTASDNFDPDSTPNNGVDTDNDGNVENDPDDEDDGDGELPGDDGVQPTSDISLDKTSAITVDADNSTTPSPGDTVEFTISVNNNGPNEAPGVVVTDELPDGYTMTGNTPSQGSYDTNTGVWTIGTIANQATVTLTITATINATGEYTNLAEVTASDNFDPDSTPNNGVDTDNDGNVENDPDDEDDGDGELPGDDGVQPTSDISLDKTSAITNDADASTTPSPGDTVEFTISVNNNGPNEAPGVVVTDQIPTGYTLTNNTASQGSYDSNTGVWTIGTIANQATVTLTITATINATGEYTNLAEVTASDNFDPDSTPNNGVDTDNDGNVENDPDDEDDGDGELPGDDGVQPTSDISLDKTSAITVDADNSTTPSPGDTVEFTISVNNNGPNEAPGVVVTDELPDGYTMTGNTPSQGSYDTNTGVWTIGTIANQATVTLTITATINATGEYTNLAEVTASDNFDPDSTPNNGVDTDNDGNVENDPDDEDDGDGELPGDDGVQPTSDISLDKTSAITVDADNSTTPSPGDTVEFTISVNNNGPNEAPGVVVTDELPDGYTMTGNTPSQGSYDTNTGVWTIGTIANQATVTLTITATINATGEYTNLAEVTASDNFDPDSTPNNGVDTDNDGNVENDPDDEDDGDGELPGDDGVQPTSDISLDKTSAITNDADASTTPSPGDTVEFTISVNNNGPNEAPGVVVTDELPDGYTMTGNTPSQGSYDTNTGVWTIGTIANQATVTLTITATINATGEYTNLAEVTASDNFDPDSTPNNGVDTDNDGNVENDPDDEDDGDGELPGDDGVQPTSDISLDKTSAITNDADASTTPSPGDTVEFTISVNNNGPNEAPGVVVTDQIPTGYTLTDNTASQGSYDTNTGVWTIGTIANQATVTLTITATINATGEYTNLAEVTASDNFDPDSTPNNGVDTDNDGNVENDPDDEDDGDGELPGDDGVQPTSDISLDKTSAITNDADASTTPSPGDTVEFTISVNNNGPNEAPGVVVTDELPDGYTMTGNTPSQGSYDSNTGIWTIGTIANQATVTLTITATINATGEYTNLAEVTASDNFDPDSTPNNGVDTDNDGNVENDPDDEDDGDGELPGDDGVQPTSDISLDKTSAITVDADNSTTPSPGDTVEFTISVNNNGPNEAPGVVVTDQIPTGYTLTDNTPSQGSYDTNTGVWTIGTIANQATVTLVITATINATGEYTNLAEVTASDNFDPDSTPNNGVDTDNDGNVENDPDDEDDGDGEEPGDDGVQPTSDISLDKTSEVIVDADASGTPTPNDTVVFTVSVTNNGPNDATGIAVTDQLPDGYTMLGNTASQGTYDTTTGVWAIGTITNQATVTLAVEAIINATGDYVNLAEVTASDNFDPDSTPDNGVDTDNDGNVENDPDDEDDGDGEIPGDDGVQPTSDISLDKTSEVTVDADASGTPTPNDTVVFTVSVTNNGPNDATGIAVTDQLPDGYTMLGNTASQGTYDTTTGVWAIGTIANQATVTLAVEAIINATGDYVNLAEVTASDNFDPDSTPNNGVDTDNDGNVENDPDDEDDGDGEEPGEDGVQPTSDISLDKKVVLITDADGSGGPTPFDTVEFTITVTNSGPNNATGIVVKDELPAGYTMVNSSTTTGTVYASTEWTIPTLGINESVVLTVLATINPDGPFTNFAEVIASDNFDPDSTPNNGILSEDDHDSADPKVKFVSDLRIDLTSDKEVADVGETVVYTIELTNDGPNRSTNVRVKSLLPSGLEYIIHRNGNYNVQDGIWEIGDIEVDETKKLEIDVTVLTPQLLDNEHLVEAEVVRSINFDPDSTPNNGVITEDDYDSILLRLPIDLSITKTVDEVNPIVNHEVMFTISVTNPTVMEATGVIVEDLLPEGYIYVSHTTDAPGSTYNDTNGEWNIGTVPGNTTVTLLLTVQVNEFADYPSGDYINTTTIINVDQDDFVSDNNIDTAETKPICLTIYNVFSPNGDGVNDYFKIDCLDKYPNNTLQIYNRWGREVYNVKGYDNKWTGISNGNNVINRKEGLPDGTYFYILNLGDGFPQFKGWLTISRGQ